jgi:hypothetical protein
VRALYSEVDSKLFITGQGPFFDEYPAYKQALLEIMPPNSQTAWEAFHAALYDLERAVRLVQASYNGDTFGNAEWAQRRLGNAMNGIHEFAAEAARRINLMVEAIPP